MYPRTNYTLYLKNFLEIKDDGSNLSSIQGKSRDFITNPILSTLIKTYNPELLKNKVVLSGSGNIDMAYARLLGHSINCLKGELEANPNYKKEIKRKLLNSKFGSFYTAYAELFVGGYLKNIGYKVEFNSSKEEGLSDIISVKDKETLSNEVKTYPDREAWLEDTLTPLMPSFWKILNSVSNVYLFVFATKMHGFRNGIIKSIEEYFKTRKDVKNDFCWITNVGNIYGEDEGILIASPKRNAQIRFKVSFDAYHDTKSLFEKSVKQNKFSRVKGITWMLFPHPKPISLERKVLWYDSSILSEMKNNGIGVVLFEVFPTISEDFTKWEIQSGANFLLTPEHESLINSKSFNDYIDFLISKSTLLT